MKTARVFAPIFAGIVCAFVALNEWMYRQNHRHAAGPSGWIAALAVAGLILELMTEPTRQQLEQAVKALVPFVREWRLSLNPEDLELMA
jgi:hypothetical protein